MLPALRPPLGPKLTHPKNNITHIYLWISFSVLLRFPCSLSIIAWLSLPNFSNSPSPSTNWNLSNNDMRIILVIEESVIEARHPMASWENENKKYLIILLFRNWLIIHTAKENIDQENIRTKQAINQSQTIKRRLKFFKKWHKKILYTYNFI